MALARCQALLRTVARLFATGLHNFGGYGVDGERRYYDLLGVSDAASVEEIKRSFKQLALRKHPDRGGSEEEFKALQHAYSVLSDPESRRAYDRFGAEGELMTKAREGTTSASPSDYQSILEALFQTKGLSGAPSGRRESLRPLSPSSAAPPGALKPATIEQTASFSLEELFSGVTKPFSITRQVVCPHCHGLGARDMQSIDLCRHCEGTGTLKKPFAGSAFRVQLLPCTHCGQIGYSFKPHDKCPLCQGQRTVRQKSSQTLRVPPATAPGGEVLLSEVADEVPGGRPGDIRFRIQAKPHPLYTVSGSDLFYSHPIAASEAAKGFDFVLPLLSGGAARVKSAEGDVVSGGATRVLRGQGFLDARSGVRGDLFINFDPSAQRPRVQRRPADYARLPMLTPEPAHRRHA